MYGCEFVTRLSLAAEWIGVCNFSWLLYGIARRIFCREVIRMQIQLDSTKTNTTSDDQDQLDPSSPTVKNRGPNYDNGIVENDELNWFDYLKYLWSTVATLGAIGIVCYGISIQAYVLPTPPGIVKIIITNIKNISWCIHSCHSGSGQPFLSGGSDDCDRRHSILGSRDL